MNSSEQSLETAECPFPDCDWDYRYDPEQYYDELDKDFAAEQHYEREHAGRVRIQVTLEKEQMLCERDPREIRERLSEEMEGVKGFSLAYVRTEVLEDADDHSRVQEDEEQ